MKIDKETAVNDFDRFIEKLKIKARKLTKLEEEKELLILLIQEGNVEVDNEGMLKYKLDFPILNDKGETFLSELNFRARGLTADEVNKSLGGKNSDMDKTINTLSVLTKQNSAIIKKINSDEFSDISNSIMAFFLPR